MLQLICYNKKKIFFWLTYCVISFASLGFSSEKSKDPMPSKSKSTSSCIQKEIKLGNTPSELLKILGTPSGIFFDEFGQESWVYNSIDINSISKIKNGWLFNFPKTNKQTLKKNSNDNKTVQLVIEFNLEYRLTSLDYQ